MSGDHRRAQAGGHALDGGGPPGAAPAHTMLLHQLYHNMLYYSSTVEYSIA